MCLQAGPAALVKLPAKSANIDANTIKIQKPPITSIISCHKTKRKGEKGLPKRNRLRSLLEDYRFSSFLLFSSSQRDLFCGFLCACISSFKTLFLLGLLGFLFPFLIS